MNITARRLRWTLLVLGAAFLAFLAFSGYQAVQVRDDFNRVAADVTKLRSEISAGDLESARRTLTTLQRDAQSARSHTEGPAWWLTERLPALGPNVSAIRTVAATTDTLAQQALPKFLAVGELLKPENLRPSGGAIDVATIERAVPDVLAATSSLKQNVASVHSIDPKQLVPSLADAVTQLQGHLDEAMSYANRLSIGVQVLPGMLGADGTRNYLLVVENNAELRSGGGIAGAFAQIRVAHGRIRLVDQGSSATIGSFAKPVIKTTPEENALLGPRFALFPQNITQSPDFSRTALLARAMWRRATGTKVDGVVSIDPVALSYLLRGLGPVTAPDGTEVTADNAVSLLMNGVYEKYPVPAAQDAFFTGVARAVFDKIASGAGDSKQVLSGLVDATNQGRIHVWSAVPKEESLIADTPLAGLVRTTSDGHPSVGVYFNESTASKMDYYLGVNSSLTGSRCRAGAQQLRLRLRLTNTLHQDPSSLPVYVVGQGDQMFPPGTILLTIYVLAPVDGTLTNGLLDGKPGAVNYLTYAGRSVGAQTIPIMPGRTRTVSFKVTGGKGALLDPRLTLTPTAQGQGSPAVDASRCG